MLYSVNTLPTHLVVGAKKAATTWIWKQVENREEVSTAVDKEVWYFTDYYDCGIEWYKNKFKPNKVILDNTPDYFFPGIAERIYKTLPHARIMVCLRNPIDRSFSHFKHARFINSIDNDIDFLDAWRQDRKNIRTKSLYPTSLKEFQSYFDKNLNVFLYDDLESNPHEFVQKFYNFLGISPIISQNFEGKWIPWVDKDNKKLEIYKNLNKYIILSKDEKDILIDYYGESIIETQNIINRDLSSWMK